MLVDRFGSFFLGVTTRPAIAVLLLAQGLPGFARAAEPAVSAATPSSSGGYTLISVLMLMLLALGVAALAWLMRRNAGVPGVGGALVRVVAAQPLGQRERLVVVKVGERLFLLGHTASQISMLSELNAEDVPVAPVRLPENVFADLLAKIRK